MNIQEQIKQLEERFQKELSELKEKATQEEKKQEFKEGGYAKIIKEGNSAVNELNYSPFKIGEIFRIGEISTQKGSIWLRSEKGKTNGVHSNLCIVPPPEEIESHLIEEAKKRFTGKVGRVFKNAGSPEYTHILESDEFRRFPHSGCSKDDWAIAPLTGHGLVYWNGEWAEILPSTPEIEIGNQKVDLGEKIVTVLDKGIHSNRFIDASKLIKDLAFDESVVVTGIMVKKCNGDELLIPSDAINEISSYYEKEGE